MTALLLETLGWSVMLALFAFGPEVHWWVGAAFALNLVRCLLEAPGKALEEEAEAAHRARLDAEWDELLGIGGGS